MTIPAAESIALTDAAPDFPRPIRVGLLRHFVALFLMLVALTLAHGWELGDGLALDDHWHFRSVRDCPWTLRGLLDATTLDVEPLIDVWWQKAPVRFMYARPAAAAVLKIIYGVTNSNVAIAHGVSLLLHLSAGVLVYALALRFARHWGAAVVGALAFILFPQSVFAVGWLAAQNMVLATVLMLAAVLAYLRAAETVRAVRWSWYVATLLLWLLALGSRESALFLPVILVGLDVVMGGAARVRRSTARYVPFGLVIVAFTVWRTRYFHYPMPDIYVRAPHGDWANYIPWATAKLAHYLSAVMWPAPLVVGPTGRYAPWSDRPLDQLAALAVIGLIGGAYVWAAHRQRGWWIWPLWLMLAMVPMTAILATPHSGYLAAPAVCMGVAAALANPGRGWLRALGRAAVIVVIVGVYGASNKAARLMWRGIDYAEEFVHDDMRADPPPAGATDVFCINLPFAAIYAPLAIAERGAEALPPPQDMGGPRWHVLTFAPSLPRMEERCRLTQLDEYSFELEVGPRKYFSGLLGRFLLQGFGRGLFAAAEHYDRDRFAVEVLNTDASGVEKLRFTFKERLDSPRYCFYLSSFTCGAVRLDFKFRRVNLIDFAQIVLPQPRDPLDVRKALWAMLDGDARSSALLFGALSSKSPDILSTCDTAMRLIVPPIGDAMALPPPQHFAEAMYSWFCHAVDDRTLRFIFRNRERRYDVRHRRDELKRARALSAEWIRSDMYFTGPPFADPR